MPIPADPTHIRSSGDAYVDTGTGNVPFNEKPVTYSNDFGSEPTGLVEGPPAEVTVQSEDHEGAPTGAVPGPPAEVTSYEWPATAPANQAAPQDQPAVEDDAAAQDTPQPATRAAKKRS